MNFLLFKKLIHVFVGFIIFFLCWLLSSIKMGSQTMNLTGVNSSGDVISRFFVLRLLKEWLWGGVFQIYYEKKNHFHFLYMSRCLVLFCSATQPKCAVHACWKSIKKGSKWKLHEKFLYSIIIYMSIRTQLLSTLFKRNNIFMECGDNFLLFFFRH